MKPMDKLKYINETILDFKNNMYKGLCGFDLIIGLLLIMSFME